MSRRHTWAAWLHWPWVLWAAYGVALAVALLALPPLAQDPAYHAFADVRTLWGIPRFGDVASNAALLLPALWGLAVLWRQADGRAGAAAGLTAPVRAVYGLFFAAVALTALGSAVYHWAPDTPRLFWDRLPLGLATACAPALLLAERAGLRAARQSPGARRAARWALGAWLALGPATVVYWRASEALGAGDLRPYVALKLVAVLAAAGLLAALPRRHTLGWVYALALALYVLAGVVEHYDAALFQALGAVSGHTLKHLSAGAAVAALAWMLARRRAVAG
jgi:hypothetical protein